MVTRIFHQYTLCRKINIVRRVVNSWLTLLLQGNVYIVETNYLIVTRASWFMHTV